MVYRPSSLVMACSTCQMSAEYWRGTGASARRMPSAWKGWGGSKRLELGRECVQAGHVVGLLDALQRVAEVAPELLAVDPRRHYMRQRRLIARRIPWGSQRAAAKRRR